MIALQTLKYKILDYCLTKLFEGINNNLFNSNCIDIGDTIAAKDLRVGMVISRIYSSVWVSSMDYNTGDGYHICKILEISPRYWNNPNNKNTDKEFNVIFSYDRYGEDGISITNPEIVDKESFRTNIIIPGKWIFEL